MRLPHPFIRLPFAIDAEALAAEVDAVAPTAWKAHAENAPGNTAVPLVAAHGDPDDDAVDGPMLATPHLAALPYARRVMGALDSVIGRSRLMRIREEGDLFSHVDVAYYWRDHLRVHVPVVSDPSVEFHCDGAVVHMAPGEVWVFDTWRVHKVVNPASHARTHLVIDTVGGQALWDLIDQPDREARTVTLGGAEAPVVTELVNKPVVASPWELEVAARTLLGEVALRDTAAAEALLQVVTPILRAWRNAWARFGDDPAGHPVFARLRREAQGLIARTGGSVKLPNGITFAEAMHNHALIAPGPASPAPAAPTPAPPAPAAAVAAPTAAPASRTSARIERPIFIVASPRSGSTLLFETLARSPDLFTIGSESHTLIEGIPGLAPEDHDWESNRLTAADARAETGSALRSAFIARLRNRNGRPALGPVRMLEKTPKNGLRIPFLLRVFPDAQFIYLYRDPRETVSSMLDAWRSGGFVTYPDLPGWTGLPWSLLLVPGWRDLIGKPLAEVVTTQWATATNLLLDDLEDLPPDRWCVISYDQLLGDPHSEMERLAAFAKVGWDTRLEGELPHSRTTLDSPHPDKWMRNADEMEPVWDRVVQAAARAHDVFAAPPRTEPVRASATADRGTDGRSRITTATAPDAPPEEVFGSSHTTSFPALLAELETSLLVSTYQTGHLIAFREADGVLNTHFRQFPSPMGMARHGQYLALGTRAEVVVFHNQPQSVHRLADPGPHDACFIPRTAYTTGDIRIHDLAYAGGEPWIVNTRFSCLATLDGEHSFVPRWRPPFITALAPEDRCHLNGLCVVDDEPRFVTMLGMFDEKDGWRDRKLDGGVLMHVPSGEVVSAGMCMPHSPRWHAGRLWLLESGRGELVTVDLDTGERHRVGAVPGFARGLALVGPYAFIGLSQVREHVFDDLPLTGEGVDRNCGVWVLDVRTGAIVAWAQFRGQVEEIFEVLALPGIRYPEIVEQGADLADGAFVLPDHVVGDVPADLLT
ncbi:MAG: TIGR03032 family protein [Actinobacteria bacterium]|nr:TIGR03032 family protein [Actinomycetota bacterium]